MLEIKSLTADVSIAANAFIYVLAAVLVLAALFIIAVGIIAVFADEPERRKSSMKVFSMMLKFFMDIVRTVFGLFRRLP